ncbi:MAG: DciA family protein [Phycisphaerales bacterium]|nr:DciA family protein [Phycisphaerales bacterium]
MSTPNQLEQLQRWRHRPQRAKAIGDGVAIIDRRARQLHRRIGEFMGAWKQSLPQELHERTCVEGIRGGVVDVLVSSSAISFELDRRLREGLLDELRASCRGTVVRVRLRVGALNGSLLQS